MTSSLVGSEMCIRDSLIGSSSASGIMPSSSPRYSGLEDLPFACFGCAEAVSYTHLRAHETRRHL
eukprot:11970387-Prorocentrum_lima.AAC.1